MPENLRRSFWTAVQLHLLHKIAVVWNYMSKDTLRYRRKGAGDMRARDEYLLRAAHLLAKAGVEANAAIKDELENMARCYLRLAEQAKRNDETDIVYEAPPSKDRDQA